MSASHLPYPRWQQSLLQAVLETKPDGLMEKLKIAEIAISGRLRELEGNPGRKGERVALYDAISRIRDLKEVLIEPPGLEN